METPILETFKEKLLGFWQNLIQKSSEDEMADMGRERIVVFCVSLILATCFWFMVNLSRDYTISIDLPIVMGAVPGDRAITQPLPETAEVSVSGEGWKLLSMYNNPPTVNVDVQESEINLYDQVQRQMNTVSGINIQKVQPLILTLNLEKRISKKVPVRPILDVSFESQYGFLGAPAVQPDSITISGAASLLKEITQWPTDTLSASGVSKDIMQPVALQSSQLIQLSRSRVQVNAPVSQYTEGEREVIINTRNLPAGEIINYSPSSVTVRFNVPIREYPAIEDQKLFNAYINYQQILEDSTGYVTPQIEQVAENKHIKIRSFQPKQVAYFLVLDE